MDFNRLLSSLLIVLLFLFALPIAQYAERQNTISIPPVIPSTATDIELLWSIEDTRTESAVPLVTYLENNGSPLGYDAASNTFYCTLGLDVDGDWPEIQLTASDAQAVSVCFVDDFSYDWCSDAIAEGYSYELMAYTDTEYAYFNLIFTGLPIVSLYTEQAIDMEYIPCFTSVSSAQHEPVKTLSKVHLRGALSLRNEKSSYRLEFHRINQTGKDKKNKIGLLGMPADSDWLLCANPLEYTGVRNHLAWNLWKDWNPDNNAYGLLESRMVEVFVNNEYRGLYQLMQRIDTDAEIERMGGNIETDCAFRVIMPANAKNHAFRDYKSTVDVHMELRKAPQDMNEDAAFRILEPYVELADRKQNLLDNESFLRQFEKHMDTEDVISYFLFSLALSLSEDNVYNNLYIWATKENDRYRFTFSPWDMDRAFMPAEFELNATPLQGTDYVCLELRIPVRLLDLDGFNSRQILWTIWKEKRTTILSDDAVYHYFEEVEKLVNASGAYARNAEKWTGIAEPLNISETCGYAIQHLNTLDRYMRESWPYGDYTPDGKSVFDIE